MAILIGLALLGCSRDEASRASPAADASVVRQPNVVLIVMDTTRADRLGCYGGVGGLTPNIDALAARGTRFGQAFAQAPWTLPSVASLLTSTHPVVNQAGGRIGKFTALSPKVATIAEVFKDSGYQTGAIVNVMFLSDIFGMTRGFGHVSYFDSTNDNVRTAAKTTDAALRWIETVRDRPFFALVHYFDPHLVYNPPEEFRQKYAAAADPGDPTFGTIEEMIRFRSGKIELTPERIRRFEQLYNGEIAYTDQEIGRLLGTLRDRGFEQRTIVALVADHGEEFLDHGGFEHGHSLFDELLHVPLILAGVDIPAGRVVTEPVGLTDVAPTLCEIAGVAVPPKFAGWSLVPAMEGLPLNRRALLSHGNMWGPELDALRRGAYKLIRFRDTRILLDVQADPREQRNLAADQPAVVGELDQELSLLLSNLRAEAVGDASTVALTPEQRERLCALGYINCGS